MDTKSVGEAQRLTTAHVMETYRRLPLTLVRGEGSRVWDDQGRSYLDFVSGLAVTALGHCHPKVTAAICTQAKELAHTSNIYYTLPQAQLAEELTRLSSLDRVFFCNSGAEANEAALKLARIYQWRKTGGVKAPFEVVTAEHSFHGRTFGAMTATGQRKYQDGFTPLVPGFRYVPFNDLAALEAAITPATAAVMLEPIQGEGGIHPASQEYLVGARRLCDAHGVLLILDEVQTGLARTGRMFAFERYGIVPDIVTLAKALGGGLPLGATLARAEVAVAFQPGNHASTFGGNPVCCAAGLAVLGVMTRDRLAEQSERLGAYLVAGLQALGRRHPAVGQIRGFGLMLGVDVAGEAAEIAARCREGGLLINAVGPHTLRLLPPLTASTAEVDAALVILEAAFGSSRR